MIDKGFYDATFILLYHVYKGLVFFLGHLNHSGDLLVWAGVCRHPSCGVCRPLTSSSQELLGQS